MKMKHKNLIILSGLLWTAIGFFLLYIGLGFIAKAASTALFQNGNPLLSFLSNYFEGPETSAVFLIVIALSLGTLKSRMVFAKVINKMIVKIRSFPDPVNFTQVYGLKYLFLMGIMMSFGFAMKYFEVSNDIRGVVDVAVGSALLNGGISYFRFINYPVPSKI
jgi:hypothetical protein